MALDWKSFILRPHIRNLTLNEQLRLYNIERSRVYNQRRQQQFLIKEQLANYTQPSVSSGAAGDEGTTTPLLLLDIPGATTDIVGGWSLRKLKSDYTGAPIRVRRESDSVEQDISFTSDGYIDEDELTTFASGGTTRVVKWYDQSGQENHFYNSGTSQPYMTNSSGNPYKNGDFLYILESVRTYLRLTNTLGFTNFGPRSVLALNYFASATANPRIWYINKNAGQLIQSLFLDSGNSYYISFSNRTTTGVTTTYASTQNVDGDAFNLISSILRPSPDETEIYYKGNKIISESAIPNFDYFFDFLTPEASSSGNQSDPTEIVVYETDQLANVRVAMENNINTYYSIS